MNQTQALRIAAEKFGARAYVRAGKRPSSPLARRRAHERLAELRASKPQPFLALSAWPAETTIGEYRTALADYNAAYRAWKEQEGDAAADAHRYCFAVGTASSLFFEVKGEGDSWEEALLKAGCRVPVPKSRKR